MQLISMIKLTSLKRSAFPFLIIILSAILLTIQSCKKKRPQLATILYKKTHNKVFKNFEPEDFSVVLKKVLEDEKSKMKYGSFILDYYEKNDYTPEFVMQHLFNGDLATAAEYYSH